MIHISETLMRRYLHNALEALHQIIESGSEENKMNAASQLAHLVMTIHRMNFEEDDPTGKFPELDDDDEGEEWKQ